MGIGNDLQELEGRFVPKVANTHHYEQNKEFHFIDFLTFRPVDLIATDGPCSDRAVDLGQQIRAGDKRDCGQVAGCVRRAL
jgi:hypothetical protein